MSNNFKFILFLYFFLSCFYPAAAYHSVPAIAIPRFISYPLEKFDRLAGPVRRVREFVCEFARDTIPNRTLQFLLPLDSQLPPLDGFFFPPIDNHFFPRLHNDYNRLPIGINLGLMANEATRAGHPTSFVTGAIGSIKPPGPANLSESPMPHASETNPTLMANETTRERHPTSFVTVSMPITAETNPVLMENEAEKATPDTKVNVSCSVDISHSENEPDRDPKGNQSPEPALVLARSMSSEKKAVFTSNPKPFLAAYQLVKKASNVKKVIPKENASPPIIFQASPGEETPHTEEFFAIEELEERQASKRGKPLSSLLHQQHQDGPRNSEEHSGGEEIADPLDTFLSLFKGFFETVWGRLIVKIG